MGQSVTEVDQYFVHNDGTPSNNRSHIYEVELLYERPSAKIENYHELVWLPLLEVIKQLKNDGFAQVMATWLRRRT